MNNLKKEIQTVKFNLAVGEAKPGPLLAPILGQSQINIQLFCKEFIDLTAHVTEGVKLPVKIKKYEDKSFKIFYQAPTLNYIYEQIIMDRASAYLNDNSIISVFEILDILNIIKAFLKIENVKLESSEYYLKQILSFLATKKVAIKRQKL